MTELAEALSGERVTVLVKNPLNPDIELWEGALLRLYQAGIPQIGAIHRGSAPTAKGLYRNAPLWQIPIELRRRHPELTILVDPSHIAGRRDLVPLVSRMGLEMNFSGLMARHTPSPRVLGVMPHSSSPLPTSSPSSPSWISAQSDRPMTACSADYVRR